MGKKNRKYCYVRGPKGGWRRQRVRVPEVNRVGLLSEKILRSCKKGTGGKG